MHVSINGVTMSYEEHGSGPAVLLLHGFPWDRPILTPHVQPLTQAGYRVVVPDLGGFGQGPACKGDCSFERLSDDLIGLLNYLGIGRAAVVGLALGIPLLDTLLQRHPQRVAAAFSLDSPPRPESKDMTRSLLDFFQGVKRFPLRCQAYGQVA